MTDSCNIMHLFAFTFTCNLLELNALTDLKRLWFCFVLSLSSVGRNEAFRGINQFKWIWPHRCQQMRSCAESKFGTTPVSNPKNPVIHHTWAVLMKGWSGESRGWSWSWISAPSIQRVLTEITGREDDSSGVLLVNCCFVVSLCILEYNRRQRTCHK